ncbi:MAG: trypsin-like peptidase domain-containing protein [Lachnospiraceae bacterium]
MDEKNTGNNTSDSLYSYSYKNQDNQERNPNYYEKKEEEQQYQTYYQSASQQADGSRTYTTGSAYVNEEGSESQDRPQETEKKKKGWHKKSSSQKKPKQGKKKTVSGFGKTLGKCAAIALVFGLVSGTVFYGVGYTFDFVNGNTKKQVAVGGTTEMMNSNGGTLSPTNVSTATTVSDVSDIAENVMPSIVSITNMGQQTANIFGQSYTQDTESAGSGIIIGQTDEAIYMVTNNHVVSQSNQLTVCFIDEQTVTADIKGTDPSTDLAVISVKVSDIPQETLNQIKVATLGKSENLKVGESLVAIGNALGYGQSVTTGVLSALNREVTIQDETNGAAITNELIQTDAAINPGNSGGALLNMNGEVIGINSVKYSDTNVEGMGYAIPISSAEPIIKDLINREVVDSKNSAYLGVSGQDVTEEVAAAYGMPKGVYITLVKEGSAAESAGIHKGDIIIKFDGKDVTSMQGLKNTLQYYAAGTAVEVVLQANENGEWQEKTISVILGKKND